MADGRRWRLECLALCLTVIAGASAVQAEGGSESGARCHALYVSKLRAAREAALRGDQKAALAGLEAAESVLRFCTDASVGDGRSEDPDASTHVLGWIAPGPGAPRSG